MTLAQLNWFDYVLLIITVFSAIFGLLRGFVREVIALLTWVAAFVVSIFFADQVAEMLLPFIKSQPVANLISFIGLFVIVLIIGALINYIVKQFTDKSDGGLMNAFLGLLFGTARGLLIVLFLIFIVANTELQQQSWFTSSTMTYWFQDASVWISQRVISVAKPHLQQLKDVSVKTISG